ncbi:MAG: hypothetical protein ACREOK_13330 [Gemmatimonadaceae bacterium]
MKALGCLFVVILIALAAFFTRDYWWPKVRGRFGGDSAVVADTSTWQPLTGEGAQRARAALEQLRSGRGPVYRTVRPGDLAAYIVQELSKTLPASADSIDAAAIGDRLYVRANIRTSELGDPAALGPFAMLLGDRERIQLGGTLRIIRPGFAELQVKEFRIREFALPPALIPRLVRQLSPAQRSPELSPDGLPLRTPDYIGDVRIADGQITLYRTQTTPAPTR